MDKNNVNKDARRRLHAAKPKGAPDRTKRNCKMIKISDKRLQGCNADQQVLMHQALVEDDKNHTEKTILLLKQVIDIQPTVPYAFALLGSIYLDQAKLLDATYHYDKRKRILLSRISSFR